MRLAIPILIPTLAISFASQIAHADDMGQQTARGAAYSLVVSEKCSGKPLPMTEVTARQRNLFVSLQKAGYDFELIKRGYLEGAMSAEGRYPGATKPPRQECKDAENIKREIAKLNS